MHLVNFFTPGALPSQPAHAVQTERSAGRLRRNPPAGSQHVSGNGQLMGGRTDVKAGIVQHQILEVHELAVDPQRGAGVGKMRLFDPAPTEGELRSARRAPAQWASNTGCSSSRRPG
ncbi:hypothetical protein QA637_28485 (plasmid) [Sinorhizobium terangae]|nr:hypothetical protein [Sinorhizobium terangae]WFU52073.1 hypothetical protein QA637_28485 [Sinorhizobium terangae]